MSATASSNPAGIPSEAMPSFLFRYFFHKDAKISKLATKEDPYHVHKTLGILSLLSFIYRYAVVYNRTGTLGFDGSIFDWTTMLIHTMLAFSSILFRVPKKRIAVKPMVIYEEYRQHAMVFTSRCFFVFSVAMVFPSAPAFVAPLVVMCHHLLADRITSIHGTAGNTAVRATSGRLKLNTFYKHVAKLYSLYQFLAIGSHIVPNARLADLAFNAIIAIQSSAFMMTLYRKRIIRGTTHMVVYALCLAVSAFHILRIVPFRVSIFIVAAFLLRINLPRKYSNKYLIWAAFFGPVYYERLLEIDFAELPSVAQDALAWDSL